MGSRAAEGSFVELQLVPFFSIFGQQNPIFFCLYPSRMKFKCLLLLFLFFGFQSLKGTHVLGGNMQYQSLDSGKVLITAKVYRDCRSTAISTTPNFGVYAGSNGGGSCGSSTLKGLTRISITEVSNFCKNKSNQCIPANTNYAGEGVEEHLYKCTVDLNKSPFTGFSGSSCCEWTFYVTIPSSISPYNNGITAFNMTLMVNICNLNKVVFRKGKNTSPGYMYAPKVFTCCQTAQFESTGALDTMDYDSLSYKLVPLKSTLPNTAISYPSPLTSRYFIRPYCKNFGSVSCTPVLSSNPTTGLFFDTSTGDIVFTPVDCAENAWRVVETNEFRKDSSGAWLKIGTSTSIINYVVVDACGPNYAPTMSDPVTYTVCAGDKICFSITGKDQMYTPFQTTPDTVEMSWDGAIPGGVFKTTNPGSREKTAEFCWQTKPEHQRDYAWRFRVTASDQICPFPVKTTRTFSIYVRKKVVQDTPKITVVSCNKIRVYSKADSVSKQQVSWVLTNAKGVKLASSQKARDTIFVNTGGKVYVKQVVSNQYCSAERTDSVVMPEKPNFTIGSDTAVCVNTSIYLKPLLLKSTGVRSYEWRMLGNLLYQSADSTVRIRVSRDTSVLLTVIDTLGCAFIDTMRIVTLGHLDPIVSDTIPSLCAHGAPLKLEPYFSMPAKVSGTDTVFSDSSRFIVKSGGWHAYPANLNLKKIDPGNAVFIPAYVEYNDSNSCTYRDSFFLKIYAEPAFLLNDTFYCENGQSIPLFDRVRIDTVPESFTWHWGLLSRPNGVGDSAYIDSAASYSGMNAVLRFKKNNPTPFHGYYEYFLLCIDTNSGCSTSDTGVVEVRKRPALESVALSNYCAQSTAMNLLSVVRVDQSLADAAKTVFWVRSFDGENQHQNTGTKYIKNDSLFTGSSIHGDWEFGSITEIRNCADTLFFPLVISQLPSAQFALNPDSIAFIPNAAFKTENKSQSGSSAIKSWLWLTQGAEDASSVVWEPEIKYPALGSYTIELQVEDSLGCRDTAVKNIQIKDDVSIIRDLNFSKVKLNSGLQIIQPEVTEVLLQLYDASGRLIFTSFNNSGILEYRGSGGVYFYTIIFSGGQGQQKVVGRISIQ